MIPHGRHRRIGRTNEIAARIVAESFAHANLKLVYLVPSWQPKHTKCPITSAILMMGREGVVIETEDDCWVNTQTGTKINLIEN